MKLVVAIVNLTIQTLNGGQCHTVRIDGGNELLVRTQTESGMEVLGHRTDMIGVRVGSIVPPGDGEFCHASQNVGGVHGLEVLLQVAIAALTQRAAGLNGAGAVPTESPIADGAEHTATVADEDRPVESRGAAQ